MRFPSGSGTRVSREPGPCWRGSPRRDSRKHPVSRARPVSYPGRRSTGVATDGATNAQEIDVSTDDEQWVRNTHYSRITCNGPGCPGQFRHVDSANANRRRHECGNRAGPQAIPGTARGSALADPAERRFGPGGGRFGRRLVLAVAPGATGAVLVMVLPARYADHGPYCAARGGTPWK